MRHRQILFALRLFLYLLILSFPVIHPGVVVPYDRAGWILWFVLLPAEMVIAFFLGPPRFGLKAWIGSAALPILLFLLMVNRFDSYTPLVLAVGIGEFLLTVLVFKTGTRGYAVAVMEQFFLGFLSYKVLTFSRASETAAAEASGITQLLFALILCAFLLHGLVLYLSAFGTAGKKRELVLFFSLAVPALLLFAFVLPPDYVTHQIVQNLMNNEARGEPIPLDESGRGVEDGNLRSDRRNDRNRDGRSQGQLGDRPSPEGGEPTLEGVPSDQWSEGRQGEGEGDSTQRAVMVIHSRNGPVYAADAYYGELDGREGFLFSRDEALNDLTYVRILDSWHDRSQTGDRGRFDNEVFIFSTIPGRALAYRPRLVEPTVLNRRFSPFVYSYRSISRVSMVGRMAVPPIRDLTETERRDLEPFLRVDLAEEDEAVFRAFAEEAIGNTEGHLSRIDALMRGFSDYQYELGFDEDTHIEKLRTFLVDTRSGDCTEFSNTAALLARLAGYPSRVVTGYLASKELQTNAHVRGLMMLREAIEPLQAFPLDELYLVTTSHRHSWTQIWLPDYGWVDFEPTSYALPPPPGLNPNAMRVVIPLIQEQTEPVSYRFPWTLALKMLLLIALTVTASLYAYRYGREALLAFRARRDDIRGLRALYRLLLMKLASRGYDINPPYRTPVEYAAVYPELSRFASLYTGLRFRSTLSEETRSRLWRDIREEYGAVERRTRLSGFATALRRALSLRGLAY